jgi:hypothetical protein
MSSHKQGWTGCSDDPVIVSRQEFNMVAVVGIDVAKHTFDIATLQPNGKYRTRSKLANDPSGWRNTPVPMPGSSWRLPAFTTRR